MEYRSCLQDLRGGSCATTIVQILRLQVVVNFTLEKLFRI